jgi:hypothetical protein
VSIDIEAFAASDVSFTPPHILELHQELYYQLLKASPAVSASSLFGGLPIVYLSDEHWLIFTLRIVGFGFGTKSLTSRIGNRKKGLYFEV